MLIGREHLPLNSALGTYALTGLGFAPSPFPSTERSSDICFLLHNYRIFAATRKSGPETKVDKIKEFVKDAGKEEEDLSVPFFSLPIICVLLSRK